MSDVVKADNDRQEPILPKKRRDIHRRGINRGPEQAQSLGIRCEDGHAHHFQVADVAPVGDVSSEVGDIEILAEFLDRQIDPEFPGGRVVRGNERADEEQFLAAALDRQGVPRTTLSR